MDPRSLCPCQWGGGSPKNKRMSPGLEATLPAELIITSTFISLLASSPEESSLTPWLDGILFKSFFFFPRDFMDPTMDNTKHILNYLMPIIDQVNPEVHDFMQRYAHQVTAPGASKPQ